MSWTQYVPRDKLSITVSCQLGWTCPPHFSCLCFPQRSQAGPAQLTKSGSGRKQPVSAHLEAAGPVTTTRVTSKSDPWTLLPQLVSSSFPCLFPATPTCRILVLNSTQSPGTVLQCPSRTKVPSFFLVQAVITQLLNNPLARLPSIMPPPCEARCRCRGLLSSLSDDCASAFPFSERGLILWSPRLP